MQTAQVSDPHLDAKIFPCAHPYGTGSVQSEGTSVQPFRVCRSRLLALQSFFRRSSRYAFWQLDMSIKRQLFLSNFYRKRCCPSSAAPANSDRFTQTYGSVLPHQILESTSWWKQQKFELQVAVLQIYAFPFINQCLQNRLSGCVAIIVAPGHLR